MAVRVQITSGFADMPETDKAEQSMLESSLRSYTTPDQRAALRRGIGDAAGICDAMARDIEAAGRSRGHVKKRDQKLAQQFRGIGDRIWAMREKIRNEPPDQALSTPEAERG